MRLLSNIINKLYLFIIVSLILLLSGHYLGTVISGVKSISLILLFGLMLFFETDYSGSNPNDNKGFMSQFSWGYILATFLLIFMTLIANCEFKNIFSYINEVLFLIITVTFVTKIKFSEFRFYFCRVLIILSIISLIGTLMYNMGIDFTLFGIVTNVNGQIYENNILFTRNMAEYTLYRNYGLFWEPGLFASFLIMGIIFQIYEEKPSWYQIALFSATLLTTSSAAGYVLLLPAIIAVFLREKKVCIKHIAFFVFGIAISIVIAMKIDSIISYLFLRLPLVAIKLFRNGYSLSVETTRISSIETMLELFKQSPIFGMGLFGVNLKWETTTEAAITSSFLYPMLAMGIGGSIYALSWMWGTLTQRNLSIFARVLLCIIMSAILNKEPHFGNLVTNIIMLYILNESIFAHKQTVKFGSYKFGE